LTASFVSAWSERSKTEVLRSGFEHHQAGRLQQAEIAYRHVLAIDAADADALHLLGVLAYQGQHHEQAIDYITQAIRQRGGSARFHANAALALCALGRLGEAEENCRIALRLDPGFAAAHHTLGLVFRSAKRLTEAESCYRESLRLEPNAFEALNNYGNVLCDLGRPAEAETSFTQALGLNPGHAETHSNLGTALLQRGRLPDAEACYRTALRLNPALAVAHCNLGNVLREMGRPAESEASLRRALDLKPDDPDAWFNLGNTQFDLDRLPEAEQSFRAALRLKPDHPKAHYNLGHILLLCGRLGEGWRHYEWRSATHGAGSRDFAQPLWTGEPLGDRVLLLHAEQGLGDTLQFCRYLPIVAPGAKIVLEVQPPLLRLLSDLPGVTQIVARGDRLPHFDAHCPLVTLPRLLGTTLETIPRQVPYLAADPRHCAAWSRRLAGLDGLKVGLVWAGGARPNQPELAAVDGRRSMALAQMAPLADVDGVSFLSLQKGAPAAQAARPPLGMVLHDFTEDLQDFADTAALISVLDLVVSVDTSVAHLAGALGKPVWLLNRFDGCWRWLRDRDDSPWYPTLRQFRQPAAGDWASVMAAVRAALVQRIGDR
jgi:tetratricopeptide (TPR) repeat protein